VPNNSLVDGLQPPLTSVETDVILGQFMFLKKEKENIKQSGFPPGWDAERVKRVSAHYESQSEEEAVAEDEAAFEALGQKVMEGCQQSPANLKERVYF